MKISKQTRAILTNYSTINSNLFVEAGNNLRTMSPSRSIVSDVTVEESFPVSFGLYDLNRFLRILSLFSEPDLDFQDSFVVISEGNKSTLVRYSEPSLLSYPKKKIADREYDVQFDLDKGSFENILKMANVMDLPDLIVRNCEKDDTKAEIVLLDLGKTDNDEQSDKSTIGVELKTSSMGEKFRFHLAVEDLRMIPDDYTIQLSNENLSMFTSQNVGPVYWLALHSS